MKVIKNLKKLYNTGEIVLNRIGVEKLQIYLSTNKIKELLNQGNENNDSERKQKRWKRIQSFKDI